MKCEQFTEQVHEFIDSALSAREMTGMQQHMDSCGQCASLYSDFLLVRTAVSTRSTLPAAAAHQMIRQLRHERESSKAGTLRLFAGWALDRIRDLEPSILWSKATALPVTLCFFAILMHQFTPIRVERLDYVVLSLTSAAPKSVTARQNLTQLNGLVNAARRLPYEDSLSLVAEITPEGNAQIGDVLEYPRSNDLLNAVDLSLQESYFETSPEMTSSIVIYSFQKIDVYEPAQGL